MRKLIHPSRHINTLMLSLFAALALVLGIYFVFLSHASTSPLSPISAGHPSSFWNYWTNGISDQTVATEAQRRRYVVLNLWDTDKLHKLKAANPNLPVFAYQDAASVRNIDQCGTNVHASGLQYCDVDGVHNDWFLTDSNGNRMQYYGYADLMDIGNPAYQQAWANKVSADVKSAGFDGVFLDNLLATYVYWGYPSTKYPNDASLQNAFKSFLSSVRGTVQANGLLELGNLAGLRTFPGTWDSYMTNLDGGFDEYWETFASNNRLGGSDWKVNMDEITTNEAKGKFTAVNAHTSGDVSAFRYAFATYMLANNGRTTFNECPLSSGDDCYANVPPYQTEYTWDLGAGQGDYYAQSGGYRRDFVCGVSVVNPNGGSAHFDFGRTLIDEDGTSRSSIDLGAQQGMVLRQSGCNPGTPSTTVTTPTPATSTPTPTATPALTPVAVPYRLDAGGPAYTDPQGNAWQADAYYTAAAGGTYSVIDAITGTTNPALFQSERWGMTSYDIPIANGTYTVKLDFAEINPTVPSRIFSVSAESAPWLTNFDIRTKTGGNFIADTETKNITVTGGVLNINFTASVENPKVSGIEILPLSSATPTPTATPVSTATPTPAPGNVTGDTDGNGRVNINDLSYLLNKWGTADVKADINHTGKVDISDLSALLAHWTG